MEMVGGWENLNRSGALDQVVKIPERNRPKACSTTAYQVGDTVDVYPPCSDKPRGWFMVLSINRSTRQIFGVLPPGTRKGDFLIVRNNERRRSA